MVIPRWAARGASIIALAAASACSHTPSSPEAYPVWPPAPAEPRIRYVATLQSQASFDASTPGNRIEQWLKGDSGQVTSVLTKPFDVAANAGMAVVTDTQSGRIIVFDLARHRVFPIGWRREGRAERPTGVAISKDGTIYVSDLAQRVVWVYDRLGLYLRTLGRDAGLIRPLDVAVDEQAQVVYVVDSGGVDSAVHRVVRIDAMTGQKLGEIGTRGTGPGQFNLPSQVAVGPQGRLYVLDSGNFRVQIFDAGGHWLRQFGEVGNQFGQFARPRGIAVDTDGHVYVSDAAFQNVQIFDSDGEMLLHFGESGVGPGRFLLPAGVACDAFNGVYVVDQLQPRIDVFRRLDNTR